MESRQTRAFAVDACTMASEDHAKCNEDAYFVSSRGYGGVFDGVGGHPGSEEASEFVAQYCDEMLRVVPNELVRSEAAATLQSIIFGADQALAKTYGGSSEFLGTTISTTAIIAKIFTNPSDRNLYAQAAYAGDSRMYILRNQTRLDVTIDHSASSIGYRDDIRRDIQQEIADAHFEYEIDPSYLGHLHERNIIASFLTSRPNRAGRQEPFRVDTQAAILQPGDTILLTTDGIHDNLTDKEIAEIASNDTMANLVLAALQRSRESKTVRQLSDKEFFKAKDFRAKSDDMTAVAIRI